jgi:hypothetical protein
MDDIDVLVVVKTTTPQQQARLTEILEQATRPDFEDELQAGESGLLPLIDRLPFPESVEVLSDTLIQYGFYEDSFEAIDILPQFLTPFGCERAVAVQTGDGPQQYLVLDDGAFRFKFSPGRLENELDDAEFNNQLSDQQKTEFKNASEQGVTDAALFILGLE